jgi:20S proteasome alpha/beta subunit
MGFLVVVLISYFWFLSFPIYGNCSSVERRSSRALPWQQESVVKREASPFLEDLPPNVFAPHGRLYQVEDAVHAVSSGSDPSSTSLVALQCKDGTVVVTTLPQSPYLKYAAKRKDEDMPNASLCLLDDDNEWIKEQYTTVPPFSRLQWPQISLYQTQDMDLFNTTDDYSPPTVVVAVTAGNAVESQILRQRIHQTAQRWRRSPTTSELGPSDWTAGLVRAVADQHQQRTQLLSGGRPVAATAVVLEQAKIYRIDPAGTFWICAAVVAGRQARRIEECLLDRLALKGQAGGSTPTPPRRREIRSILSQLTIAEAIPLATECLLEGLRGEHRSEDAPFPRPRAVAMLSNGSSSTGGGGGVLVRHYSTRELLAMVRPEWVA